MAANAIPLDTIDDTASLFQQGSILLPYYCTYTYLPADAAKLFITTVELVQNDQA